MSSSNSERYPEEKSRKENHQSLALRESDQTDSSNGQENPSSSARRSLRISYPNQRYAKEYTPSKELTRRRGNRKISTTETDSDENIVAPNDQQQQIDSDIKGARVAGDMQKKQTTTTPGHGRRSSRIISPSVRYSKDYVTGNVNPRRSGSKTIHLISTSESSTADEDEEAHEDSLEVLNNKVAATTLFEAEYDVPGTGIYGFQTPKKRGSMNALAQASSAIRTPRSVTASGQIPKTPLHVRKKNKNELSKALQASMREDFSASESDYNPSGEEDTDSGTDDDADSGTDDDTEEEEDEAASASSDDETASEPARKGRKSGVGASNVPSTPKVPVPAKLPSQSVSHGQPTRARTTRSASNKAAAEMQYIVESDNYFSTFNGAKSVTSDHTLDRLKTPRLPQDVLLRLLQETNASSLHASAIQDLLAEHEQQFTRWMFLLNEGFSVLLYGLGSKRSLLQTFHHKVLADRPVLVVNGFFPALTVKDVLDAVANDLLDLQLQTSVHHETIDEIEYELSLQPDLHVFLLVHNLDGVAMRNERMQATMCRLASIANIHLVATIDHINAPLLWDASKLSLYNFCWWDVTTMLPYSVETAFENSLLVQSGGALALSSMSSVFASLTSNARGIFMVIVKYQLANSGPTNPHYPGMQFKDLYWSCREAFLVSSDIALRAQLTEFTDHKLLRIKRSLDGSEYLNIPIEHGLLKRFVDEAGKKS
uniref:Origin recognition complex subunit 2 n=1 Tax=Anopheles minimus TaxID=112268 RepID=A0A182W4U7_9DIPT